VIGGMMKITWDLEVREFGKQRFCVLCGFESIGL
jgi:hypothetical protein